MSGIGSQTEKSIWNIALLLTLFLLVPAVVSVDRAIAKNDAKKLLQFHNRERLKRRIPRLRMRSGLIRAAQKYAQMMDEYDHFGHTGPFGSTFSERITREARGLRAVGENLALGQASPKAVHKAWMRSRSHRRNILSRTYQYVGFGKAGDEPFWATTFGG